VTSRLEKLDRHGKVDGYAERVIQVVQANGHKDQQLVRFVEDGEDKTASARKEFAEERAKPKGKRIEFEFPFRASEQPKYRFSVVGKDPNNPANVRIRYAPVGPPSEKEYLGEAWVDQSKGTLISMGFRPTKFPSFVDRADVQLEVQAATPMGPTVSRVFAQGEGGFLFIRKHFRFTLSFSDYALNPP
jgi:hypothetical protein